MKYVVTPEAVWPASKMQNHNIVAYMNSSYQMHRASAIDFVVFVLFSKRKKNCIAMWEKQVFKTMMFFDGVALCHELINVDIM